MAQVLRLKHHQSRRYLQATGSNSLVLRLRVRPPIPVAGFVHFRINGRWAHSPLHLYAATARSFYYQVHLNDVPGEIEYYFQAYLPGKAALYLGQTGESDLPEVGLFRYHWTPDQVFHTPDWVKDAIFYQIFPDRFANGNLANDPPGVEQWGARPTVNSFFGGDFEGIRKGIPYLKDLGVNALWLNPIFTAPSNHRYNTSDYLEIDSMLGDKGDFRRLVAALHEAGIRLILDGVFNHTGTGFWAFADIVEHGAQSPYLDWFYINDLPVRIERNPNYAAWWGLPELPKLRETNTLVRRYLLGVAQYWGSLGIDGWRLDVPNEIQGDFWQEFRHLVKKVNPEAYIVGEIWRDGRPWLRGDAFDAVMNYLFRDLCLNFFARERMDLVMFDRLLGLLRLRYPENVNYCQMNLLGSHDTARVFTEMGRGLASRNPADATDFEITRRLRPLIIFQLTYIGAPIIYYGDEVGLPGEEDPDCRRCFPWDNSQRNQELYKLFRRLAHLRTAYPALRRGTFETVLIDNRQRLYGFARRWQETGLLVLINAGPSTVTAELPLPDKPGWQDLLQERRAPVVSGRLSLKMEPYSGSILHSDNGLLPTF